MRQLVASAAFITSLALPYTLIASEMRHAGAHVHGLNQAQLVLDGSTLQVVYRMVAAQLEVDTDMHEHEHKHEHGHIDSKEHNEHSDMQHSDEVNQQTERANAIAALDNYHKLFHLPKAAQCSLASFEGTLQDVAKTQRKDAHDHDEHAGHQDAILQYQFDCQNPGALTSVEFEAFASYAELESVDVEALVNGRAITTRVTRQQGSVTW